MGCNYKEFEKLLDNLNLLEQTMDDFVASCAKELAARLLAKAIKRTPVDSGVLRRGWTAQAEEGAKGGNSVTEYVQALPITKSGGTYSIEIINPVKYASYVEYGHRTKGGRGFVNGKLMLTISENEIRNSSQKILERKIQKELGKAFK